MPGCPCSAMAEKIKVVVDNRDLFKNNTTVTFYLGKKIYVKK
jgi:hypothetical protein